MEVSFLARAEWKLHREIQKKKLKNKRPTILASNCNGGVILHDLGCCFQTPTVNLYFAAGDYLKFVSEPEKYLTAEPIQVESDLPYPVGKIMDITAYFMHYQTFEEAKRKWMERSARVDLDNCFLMMTDKDGCTYEDIVAFDKLPYENKVIFTHRSYPEFESAFYIPGFEERGEVGILSDFKPGFPRRRWIDVFDYVSFLNGKGIKR